MTAEAGSDGGSDAPLPLRDLESSLSPIRRLVRYALEPGGLGRVRYLDTNVGRHVGRALDLDLPKALVELIASIGQAAAGYDACAEAERRTRLGAMYAAITRLDAVAGLPLDADLRPLPKRRQADQPEADGAGATVPAKERAARPPPAPTADEPDGDLDDDEEEDSGEFSGDLSQPLSDLDLDLAATLPPGIRTVRDWLLKRPAEVEVLTPIHPAGRGLPKGRLAVSGRLRGGFSHFRRGQPPRRSSWLVGSGTLAIQWAPEVVAVASDALERPPWRETDRRVVVAGTKGAGRFDDAEIVAVDGDQVRLPSWGWPGASDRALRALLGSLEARFDTLKDPLPADVLARNQLPPLGAALSVAIRGGADGIRRLGFDDALYRSLGALVQRASGGRERGLPLPIVSGFAVRAAQVSDLTLEDAAQAVFEEIKRDLRRAAPMRRLLIGEIGVGKGRIVLLTIGLVAETRAQVLVLGADATDAEVRFLQCEPLLREVGLVARLAPEVPSAAQRDAIKRGEVHVVFGTAHLLRHALEWRRLALVVSHERENFGAVSARHAEFGTPRPHLLVAASVPVGPRALAEAFADHHVSELVDPQRWPASFDRREAGERSAVYVQAREAVREGHQAVVFLPMVDGRDAIEIADALRLIRALEADVLADCRVGLLHGSFPQEERQRALDDLTHRRVQVLVTTTRLEDTPAVPGVTVVIVEQADRVDSWRMARIVGWTCSAAVPARVFAVAGEPSDPRPSVDAASAAAVAPPAVGWLDLDRDLAVVLAAREEAHRLTRHDPTLKRTDIGRELRARWDSLFPDAAAACPVGDEAPVERRRRRRRRRRGR